jgi:hypothetical protein
MYYQENSRAMEYKEFYGSIRCYDSNGQISRPFVDMWLVLNQNLNIKSFMTNCVLVMDDLYYRTLFPFIGIPYGRIIVVTKREDLVLVNGVVVCSSLQEAFNYPIETHYKRFVIESSLLETGSLYGYQMDEVLCLHIDVVPRIGIVKKLLIFLGFLKQIKIPKNYSFRSLIWRKAETIYLEMNKSSRLAFSRHCRTVQIPIEAKAPILSN